LLKIQKTIENFFNHEVSANFSKKSKRMVNAINKYKNKSQGNSVKSDDLRLSEEEIEEEGDKERQVEIEIVDESSNEAQVAGCSSSKNTKQPKKQASSRKLCKRKSSESKEANKKRK
jgi:hypothetical protein